MNIYRTNKIKSNHLKGRERNEGMCLEEELEIAQNNGVIPEKNMSSVFYTQRKDGVLSSTDIRTDKWELAQNAMSHANKKFKEKIEENIKNKQQEKETNQEQKIE